MPAFSDRLSARQRGEAQPLYVPYRAPEGTATPATPSKTKAELGAEAYDRVMTQKRMLPADFIGPHGTYTGPISWDTTPGLDPQRATYDPAREGTDLASLASMDEATKRRLMGG